LEFSVCSVDFCSKKAEINEQEETELTQKEKVWAYRLGRKKQFGDL
jgi:hypothetical protein